MKFIVVVTDGHVKTYHDIVAVDAPLARQKALVEAGKDRTFPRGIKLWVDRCTSIKP